MIETTKIKACGLRVGRNSVSKHLQSLTVEGGNDRLNQGFGGSTLELLWRETSKQVPGSCFATKKTAIFSKKFPQVYLFGAIPLGEGAP